MIEQLILSLGGTAVGLGIAWRWIETLREDIRHMRNDHANQIAILKSEHDEEIKCLTDAHNSEVTRIQQRLDRMHERQQQLMDRALRKTDLKDTDH